MTSISSLRPLRLAATTLLLAACSSSSGPSGATSTDTGGGGVDDSTSAGDSTGSADASDALAETATPCGYNMGDVLCDLDLQGYLRNDTSGLATSVDLTTFKVSEALAAGAQPYAFVFNAAYW